MYDEMDIELLRKRGAPDPEGNVARANRFLEVLRSAGPAEARPLLDGITDPVIRKDLETLLEVRSSWSCIIP